MIRIYSTHQRKTDKDFGKLRINLTAFEVAVTQLPLCVVAVDASHYLNAKCKLANKRLFRSAMSHSAQHSKRSTNSLLMTNLAVILPYHILPTNDQKSKMTSKFFCLCAIGIDTSYSSNPKHECYLPAI